MIEIMCILIVILFLVDSSDSSVLKPLGGERSKSPELLTSDEDYPVIENIGFFENSVHIYK